MLQKVAVVIEGKPRNPMTHSDMTLQKVYQFKYLNNEETYTVNTEGGVFSKMTVKTLE